MEKRIRIVRSVVAGMTVALPAAALACGADYGKAVPNAEAIQYVGFARDEHGKPVPKAHVLVTVGEGDALVADQQGHFRDSLGIANDPDEVQFVCNKEGFASAMGVRAKSKIDPRIVYIICSMHHK